MRITSPKQPDCVDTRRWLFGIVLAGIILRFVRLGFPPALTDEAFTFWRTCGTLGQLLDTLRVDGFAPLHLEFVWLATKIFGQQTWVLRLPSTIAGALMPVAMFWLARAIWDRRVGLYAAAFAAAGAHFSFHARDAKMYMTAWTAMTASLAAVLIFSKTRGRVAWLAYVFFGMLATGCYALTGAMVAAGPIAALVWAKRARRKVFAVSLLGAMLALSPVVIYYATFNRWFSYSGGLSGTVATDSGASKVADNGILWVDRWQQNRTPANTLLSCVSVYLFDYEWPAYEPAKQDGYWLEAHSAYRIAGVTLWVLAIAAAVAGFALIFSRGSGSRRGRQFFLILLLAALPLYVFYLRSYEELLAPWRIASPIATLGIAVAIAWTIAGRTRQWKTSAIWCGISIATAMVVWLVVNQLHAHAPRMADGSIRWNNVWMPRYAGIVAPMLLATLAAAVAKLPTRPLRWLIAGIFLVVNLSAVVARLTLQTEIFDHQIAADAVATIDRDAHRLLAVSGFVTDNTWPGFLPGPYYRLIETAGVKTDPIGFRDGHYWPYHPGPDVLNLLDTMRVSRDGMMLYNFPPRDVNTIVIWQRSDDEKPAPSPPTIRGFRLVNQQSHVVRHVWTWTVIVRCSRFEFVREK